MKTLKMVSRHAAIVLSLFYVVLFVVDRINNAMMFIDNSITKALLLILAVTSVFNAWSAICEERARKAKALKRKRRQ